MSCTYQWSPSWSLRHPTYLSFTNRTLYPITALLLHNDHLTLRTRHSVAILHHLLDHDISLIGCLIVSCSCPQVILILLAVHSLMDRLTSEAVFLPTHRAYEEVDMVLVDTPSRAVSSLAVEAVPSLALCCLKTASKVLFIYLWRN